MSDVDREIIDQVDRRGGDVSVFILRGRSDDGTGSWQIDPEVSRAEAIDMGGVLLRTQMPVWRHFLLSGVQLTLHYDWGAREVDACQAGMKDLEADLAAIVEQRETSGGDDELFRLARLDLWLARHMVAYMSGDLEHALSDHLPQKLGLLAARLTRIRELVRALHPSSLDQPTPAGIP